MPHGPERVRPGPWRHWKGGRYDVVDVAVLAGTEDAAEPTYYVIYRPQYGKQVLTVRPLEEFIEERPGGMPRFMPEP